MPSPYPFPRMWQTVALHSNIRTKEQWPSNTDPSHAVHMIGSLVYAHEREPCNSAGGRIRRFFVMHAGCRHEEGQREGLKILMLHAIFGHPRAPQGRSTRPLVSKDL